jgi:hypothetical protein
MARPKQKQKQKRKRNFDGLPDQALLRLYEVVAPDGPLPHRRTKWLELVATGDAPAPAIRQPRLVAWTWGQIRTYLDSLTHGVTPP